MDRISAANTAPGNLFRDGNPGTGQQATSFNAVWANGVQEEMMTIIEAAGLVPDAGVFNQLFKGIINLVYRVGDVLETMNDELTPNQRYPWQTWVEDTSGRVTVSRSEAQPEFDATGKTGGSKTHTLTVAQLPETQLEMEFEGFAEASGGSTNMQGFTVGVSDTTLGTITNDTAIKPFGAGEAHNNLQPYIVRRVWVRTA